LSGAVETGEQKMGPKRKGKQQRVAYTEQEDQQERKSQTRGDPKPIDLGPVEKRETILVT